VVDITSKAAQEAIKARRYFSLSYDIPKTLDDLAELIRSRIRRYALAVHESGYLLPEENVTEIRDIIKAATTAINEKRREAGKEIIEAPKIRLLKIDADELPEILDWAKERAEQIVKELTKSFEERLAAVVPNVEKAIESKKIEVNDKAREIAQRKKAILRDLKKRSDDADAAFFWFASTGNAKSVLKGVFGLIDAERKALSEVAQIGETPYQQSQLPVTK
jgi:uncharacterized protein YeeX (DUF496 family)